MNTAIITHTPSTTWEAHTQSSIPSHKTATSNEPSPEALARIAIGGRFVAWLLWVGIKLIITITEERREKKRLEQET
jgi:hypothetical protein